MQFQPVPHLSLLIIAFCATIGAIFSAPLIGLAAGLGIVIAFTLLE